MVTQGSFRRVGRLLIGLACGFIFLGSPAAEAQQGLEGRTLQLQAELKSQRKRSESLRAEVKRQQRTIGELRNRVETLEAEAGRREVRLVRLQNENAAIRYGLIGLGVLMAALFLLVLGRRSAPQGADPDLASARERTLRLKDEMTALDARIRAAERQNRGAG